MNLLRRVLPIVALCFFVGALGAQAQASRTWVSGVGNDADPCSRTAPCKTFAGAISKTAAHGEISVLDPGGFGTVTITKSISIVAESAEGGILAAGTNGIIINAAATDVVTLRGLIINGFDTGLNGIRILSAAAVNIENTTIENFTQMGIDVENTSATVAVTVVDSILRNNAIGAVSGGMLVKPGVGATANVTLDNVNLSRNRFGLRIEDRSKVTASRTVTAGNTTNGFLAFSSGAAGVTSELNLESCISSNNGGAGVRADGLGATARISNVTVTNNTNGLQAVNSGVIKSFANNHVAGNTTDGAPTPPNLGPV